MMTIDLCFLTIAEAARHIRARKISPVELTEALLRRIDALDPQINTFVTVTAEQAMVQARKAESEIAAGHYRGPMHGIPFGLKDIFNTAGILTTACSKVLIDNIPKEDATAAIKLREAGAILIGKLTTHEFAHGGPSFDLPWPPARNPWNSEHITGGSSSGPGAAVAAGLIPGALGTDTGGSIRSPASLCGIVGLKPTYGLVSRAGVIPNSFSFDHCGPMTWTVEDCAIMLQVLAGHDPKDLTSANRPVPNYRSTLSPEIRGLRIGIIKHFWEEDLPANDEVRQAMDAAVDVLSHLGPQIEEVRMRPLQNYYDVKVVIAESEIFSIHQRDLIERPGDFGNYFLGRTLAACIFQAADYVQAQRERQRMVVEMLPVYRKYDVLVTAGTGPASRFDETRPIRFWQKPNIFTPFNVTGGPALTLCNGFSRGGLPLSMQIAGRPFEDETVLKVGHAYEQATIWRSRRPPLAFKAMPAPLRPPVDFVNPQLERSTCLLVEALAKREGLRLTELQFAKLCEAAPYALAMGHRIRRDHGRLDEPAQGFRL